ncbi:WAP four-disulfide core domain protein 2-like [Alligator mississippiensis]|uniref:WAP four-disulfide core domain protein 2-like n=1 Tax=Alligator mississippiensis TaxID=8496 RepID=UPI002877D839|nr:WAP four-disulfide core domain protein 2-like [Alligator mississippiensis]
MKSGGLLLLAGLLVLCAQLQPASPQKPGTCPVILPDLKWPCLLTCSNDSTCFEGKKCCNLGCNKICLFPNNKPGYCPGGLDQIPGPCFNFCVGDYQCYGPAKCCSFGCSKICLLPFTSPRGIAHPGRGPVQIHSDESSADYPSLHAASCGPGYNGPGCAKEEK